MSELVKAIRKDYKLRSLSENEVDKNAVMQFAKWWNEAVESKIDEVNAMTLSTASSDGIPSARIVLLKGFDEKGFIFYSNYNSFKGQQLAENPRACLVFFWKELERQVRITGLVKKTDAITSDEYFDIRPEGSRVAASISPQSQVISDRGWLENKQQEFVTAHNGKNIQRPPFWGGYCVMPICIEFWQGRPNRLHDRLQYTLEEDGSWKIERLAP